MPESGSEREKSIYIYIYIERERERERESAGSIPPNSLPGQIERAFSPRFGEIGARRALVRTSGLGCDAPLITILRKVV